MILGLSDEKTSTFAIPAAYFAPLFVQSSCMQYGTLKDYANIVGTQCHCIVNVYSMDVKHVVALENFGIIDKYSCDSI